MSGSAKRVVEGIGVYGQVQWNGFNSQLSNHIAIQKTLACPRINEGENG